LTFLFVVHSCLCFGQSVIAFIMMAHGGIRAVEYAHRVCKLLDARVH